MKREIVKTSLKCVATKIFFKRTNLILFYSSRQSHISATDGKWHHICVTWKNSNGEWQFYKDGELQSSATGLQKEYTIQGGGSLVLGQEQDSLGGGFESSQSFQGSLTNVNVWSYVLSKQRIKRLFARCLGAAGNLYMWSDVHSITARFQLDIYSTCAPSSTKLKSKKKNKLKHFAHRKQ